MTAILLITLVMLQCSIKAAIVAYYHLNRDYIAATLCENKDNVTMNCNGKCYLNKKINEQEKHENKLSSILKELKDVNGFLSSYVISFTTSSKFIFSLQNFHYLLKYYPSPLKGIFQPPC
jgi:ABC-type protease/lipase transport system fused ATPase/permease subunit